MLADYEVSHQMTRTCRLILSFVLILIERKLNGQPRPPSSFAQITFDSVCIAFLVVIVVPYILIDPIQHDDSEEEEPAEDYVMQRTKWFNEETRKNKGNVQLWLDFVVFQDERIELEVLLSEFV